jgi:hypothetical protein
VNSLYKENEKGHPKKNILGVGKERILLRLQRILNRVRNSASREGEIPRRQTSKGQYSH